MSFVEQLFSLNNKVAIVTGSARGNGKAIVEGLAAAGATVVAVDIIEQQNNCDNVLCDITNAEQLNELVKNTVDKYGKIDILVNNAGVSLGSDEENYPDDLWEKTLNVNITAPFKLTKLVSDQMKDQNS